MNRRGNRRQVQDQSVRSGGRVFEFYRGSVTLRRRPMAGSAAVSFPRLGLESLEGRQMLTTTVFSDNFNASEINTSLWPSSGPAEALAEVSGDAYGWIYGSRDISSRGLQSKTINLNGYSSATLSLQVHANDDFNGPESGENVLIEYRRSNNAWSTLASIDQATVSHSTFTTKSYSLPADALHSSFQLRIYATGLDGAPFFNTYLPGDNWFFDNVNIVGSRPPSISMSVPASGTDASNHSLSWSTSDPDSDAISTVSAKLLRGNSILRTSTSKNGSLTVTKADGPGTYKLEVTATDSTGASRTSTSSTLTVSDDDATGPDIYVWLGSSGAASNETQTAAQDQRLSWQIADPSHFTASVAITKNGSAIFSQNYDTNTSFIIGEFDFNAYGVGSYVLSISSTDKDNDRTGDASSSNKVINVNVINAAPTAIFDVITPSAARVEGSSISFDASNSSDPEGESLQYVWNFGDGSLARGATASHVFADDGEYNAKLTVVDEFGGVSTYSRSVIITNVAPTLEAHSPATIDETNPLTLSLAATDPGSDAIAFLVDWGDGKTESFATGGEKKHFYGNGGATHTLRVGLQDEDGVYQDLYIATVTVNDVAPVVQNFPAFASSQADRPITWDIDVLDGLNDTRTFAWDFGDGVTLMGPEYETVSHAYSEEGEYIVTLTVEDSDGLSSEHTANVVIGSPVSFAAAGQVISEDAGTIIITAQLDGGEPAAHDVSIQLGVRGDVASADYELPLAQIVIPQGELSGTVSLHIADDSWDENIEQLVVFMESTSGASQGARAEFVIDIVDDDAAPAVYLISPSQSILESAGEVTLTAALTEASGRDVFVPVEFSGTATPGSDFVSDTTIFIPAGATQGSINLVLIDDTAIESAETIIATLQPTAEASLSSAVGQSTAMSLIIAPSDAPDVSLDSAYRVTTEDTATLFITARLSRFTDETITVPVAVSGTTQSGADYRLVSGTLEFPPGASSASLQFHLIDDDLVEGVETLIVNLLPTSNANLGTNQLTVTDILDNDVARVSFASAGSSRFEGNTVPVRVVLSKPSTQVVTVPLAVSGTATAGVDFSVGTQTVVFPPGVQEVVFDLTFRDDTINEATESVQLTLIDDVVGGFLGDVVRTTIELKDTDPLVSLVGPSDDAFSEQHGTVTLGVRLSAPTDEAITIPIVYGGGAARNSDFSAPTSVTIAAGQTLVSFTLAILDDLTTESTESISVTLGSPSAGIRHTPDKATLSIKDNDDPPTVSWDSRYYSQDEASGDKTINVRLSRPTDQNVTVTLAYSSAGRVVEFLAPTFSGLRKRSVVIGRAEPDEDYTAITTVVIPKGQTSASLKVPILNDEIKENAETITIQMASVANAWLPVDASLRKATLTITDRDVLSAAEVTQLQQNVNGRSVESLLGSNPSSSIAIDFNNRAAQEDVLGALLYAVERYALTIPGPTGIAAAGVAHAIKWTQEQYGYGAGLDTDRLYYDMDFSKPSKGWYWQRLSRELASFYATQWIVGVISGYIFGPASDALLREVGAGTVEAFHDTYGMTKEGAERFGDDVTKWVKANDEGVVAIKDGSAEDDFNGGLDYYKKKVFGGYVDAGAVFFDIDFNLQRSIAEPYGVTGPDGVVVIANATLGDVNGDGVLNVAEGQWVAMGGLDTSVNQNTSIAFVAPANFTSVTPTSTLIAAMANGQLFDRDESGVKQAQARLLESLGLPDFELASLEFLQAAANGDSLAAALFAKETQFYNAVAAVARLFDAAGSGIPFQTLAGLAFDDLAGKIAAADGILNLTSSYFVKSLIQGVSVRSGIAFDPDIASAVASTLASTNAVVEQETPAGSEAYLQRVVQVHQFVQSHLSDEITQLVQGTLTISAFGNANSDVQTRIQASETHDIVPVYLDVEDATIVEDNDGTVSMVTFTVTPTAASVHGISVGYATQDSSAVAGEDYEATSGVLNWAPGDKTPRTVSVAIFGDNQLEENEAFTLVLSQAQNATLVYSDPNAIIMNDDAYRFTSSPAASDHLTLSIHHALLTLENDGEVLYDANASQGANLTMSGQFGDLLTVYSQSVLNSEQIVYLSGERALRFGEHRIQLTGGIQLSGDAVAQIQGLPDLIFAEKSATLSAVVPAQLNSNSLTYEWRVYSAGSETPSVVNENATFDFIPQEEFSLVELVLYDGSTTAVVRQELFVYPPNVPPVAAAGGPYVINEGSPLILDGSRSTDLNSSNAPANNNDIVLYEWDLDYDGSTFDADITSTSPTASADVISDNHHTRTLALRVTDSYGESDIAVTTSTVHNVAPTLVLSPLTAIDENGVATLTGTIADPGMLDAFTMTVNWGDPLSPNNFETYTFGASATGSQTFTLTHQYWDDNPSGTPAATYTIDATVTDDDSGTGNDYQTVTVHNVAPTLVLNPLTAIDENGVATLTGTIADPGILDAFTMTVNWGDPLSPNNFETYTFGASATGSQTFTLTHQYWDDNPSSQPSDTYTITAVVTDDDSGAGSDQQVAHVTNVAPTIASLSAPSFSAMGIEGSPATLTGVFKDIGALDTHIAIVNWGDGSEPEPISVTSLGGVGAFQGTHIYAAGGLYSATVTLFDDDGGIDEWSMVVVISGVGLTPDGKLMIIGTAGNDHATINQQGNHLLKVHANYLPSGNFKTYKLADVDLVMAYLSDGDDQFTISGNSYLPAYINAGAGDDTINAAAGRALLLGGLGNDTLRGGSGRSLLIGGRGRDSLDGGSAEDVLIGGAINLDDRAAALLATLAAWDSDDEFESRVDDFVATLTIDDDLEEDSLKGAAGRDLYFNGLSDRLLGVKTKGRDADTIV